MARVVSIGRSVMLAGAMLTGTVSVDAQGRSPRPITIAQALAETGKTSDTVVIAGRATAGSGQLQTTVFDVAVQDSTGGLRIFSRSVAVEVREGDSLVATGVLKRYRGNPELVASRLDVIPGTRRAIAALEIPIDYRVVSQYSGQLVRARGRVSGYGTSEGGQWLRLRDLNPEATGTLTIWVPANHGATVDLSRVKNEDSVVVTGIMSAYQDNADDPLVWQVIPRHRDDVVVPITARGASGWMSWAAFGVVLAIGIALLIGRWSTSRQLRALQETEARYRQLLELSPDAVLVLVGGLVRFANPAAGRLLGRDSGRALAGTPIDEIVPGDFRATLEAPTAPDAQGNVPRVRGQLLATGGALVDVEVTSGPCTYHDQTGVVILARDISQQLRHEMELQELALYDDLTGLHNRRGFMLFAEQELARARRDKRAPMIVFADLDKLKEINDNHGHLAGDAALTLFAAAFKSVLRETDIVARWGGDEFVALLGEGGEGAIEQLEPRLGGAISALTKPGTKYRVRATVGSSSIDPARSLTEAIERADTELYQHKKR